MNYIFDDSETSSIASSTTKELSCVVKFVENVVPVEIGIKFEIVMILSNVKMQVVAAIICIVMSSFDYRLITKTNTILVTI